MMSHLTSRQQQIVDAVLEGASNRIIAQRLGLCEQTVKNQLTRIYRKLGVAGRIQLSPGVVEGGGSDASPGCA